MVMVTFHLDMAPQSLQPAICCARAVRPNAKTLPIRRNTEIRKCQLKDWVLFIHVSGTLCITNQRRKLPSDISDLATKIAGILHLRAPASIEILRPIFGRSGRDKGKRPAGSRGARRTDTPAAN